MGILSNIFGSSKNTETIVNGAVSGLDKIFFTKEEKAEANERLADWYLKYLSATQPQNLARRLIAMVIVSLWALLVLLGIVSFAIETFWFVGEDGEAVIALFIFETMNELVHQPFMMIMGFYFLAHIVRTYQKGKK